MEVRFFLEKQRKSIDRMENRRVCMLLCKWPLIIHSMQTSAVHRMTSLKSGKYLLGYCDRRSNSSSAAASDFMLSLPPASSRKKFCILEMTTRSNANHLCVCTVEHNSCESRELHNFIVVYSAFYSLLSLTGDAIKKHEEVPIFFPMQIHDKWWYALLTGVDFHICGNLFTMGTIQIGSEVKNGPHLNGLFPWNQVHEKIWMWSQLVALWHIPISEFNILNGRSCKIRDRGGVGDGGKKTCGKTLPFNRKNCVCRHNCMYINRVEHVDHPTKTNDQTNKSGKFFFREFIVQIFIIHTHIDNYKERI